MKRALYIMPIAMALGLLVGAPAAARNYDCSKAGNANKAVCKNQAASPAPVATTATAPVATKMPAARHYDCTKAGNANKTVCKGAVAPASMPAPAPSPARPTTPMTPMSRPAASRTAAPAMTNAAGPGGATAMCGDGSYSHSAHRSGTCSRHGGVKTWY